MVRKEVLFVIITLVLFCNHSKCQEQVFKGTVRDSLTTIPLANANIVISDSQSRHYLSGTITDKAGYFSIDRTSVNQVILSVSSLGYQKKELLIDFSQPTKQLTISLAPDTVNLQEVIVTWKPLIDQNEEGDIALNIDQMGNVGELSLSDIITSIPGLSIDIDGNVLYSGYNSFTTLIDGQRMGSYYGGKPGFVLTGIAAKNIKRLEIITEPNGRFGFYTPVINIIPKGDLRDIYYASAGIGSKDKYSANIDLSKRYKKFTFNPVIDYQHISSYVEQIEERQFNNTQIGRKISSVNRDKQLSPAAHFRLKRDRNQNISLNVKYNRNNSEQNRCIINSSTTSTNDFIENTKEAFNVSTSYYQRFNTGLHSYLLINAITSYNINNSNGKQLQKSVQTDKYRNLNNIKNQTASLSLSHNTIGKKLVLYLDGSINANFTNQQSNRQYYNALSNVWDELDYYTDNRKTSRIEGRVNIGVSRLIRTKKKLSHYFKLQMRGFVRHETNKSVNDDIVRSDFYYTQQAFKYRLSLKSNKVLLLNLDNQITPPTHIQMFQPLIYIDDYTLKKGNAKLKQATNTTAYLSFGKNTNYIMFAKGSMSRGSNVEKIGYNIQLNANMCLNDIVPDYKRNNEGLIVQTWKNADKNFNVSLSTNMDWNITGRTKLFSAFTYNLSCFYTPQYIKTTNWDGSVRLRTHLPGQLVFDTKVSYNSKVVNYAITTDSYYDLRADIFRLLFKKRLRLTLSATNLLAFEGIGQVYDDRKTVVVTKRYPESPIIWIKANFLLFSYYKKI
ncbi:TonB-dependent receptor [Carboxylicivirga mesophila]|uniref:TonB-dependent receptor n=1 Tax=Carboxylicivirga mesophila TaxID=1166478 RepID=A0ABS5K7Q2_9BACT|nr:TonB-dependent receptor [Carboxylicivirga mesophila]